MWSLQPVTEKGNNELAFEVQVLIPQPFMGTIIGTGGTKIKELRSVSEGGVVDTSPGLIRMTRGLYQYISTELSRVVLLDV